MRRCGVSVQEALCDETRGCDVVNGGVIDDLDGSDATGDQREITAWTE